MLQFAMLRLEDLTLCSMQLVTVAPFGCSCRAVKACFGLFAWSRPVFPWLGRRLSADGERATQLRNEGPFSTRCTTLDFIKNLRDGSEPNVHFRLVRLRKIREQ